MNKYDLTYSEFQSYDLPEHFPLMILSGDQSVIYQEKESRLHFHNCMEIGVCLSGGGNLNICEEHFPYAGGNFTILSQNTPHAFLVHPQQPGFFCYLLLHPKKLLESFLSEGGEIVNWVAGDINRNQFVFCGEEYEELYDLLLQVIKELNLQESNYQLLTRNLLFVFFTKLYRAQTSAHRPKESFPDGRESAIAPALKYIEENYLQQFSVKFLADLCHFSPAHFRKVFHAVVGTSPLNFINNVRIAKACHLLRTTDEPILNISETVGFHSISSFNRLFIRMMQMSPREYRKRERSRTTFYQNG